MDAIKQYWQGLSSRDQSLALVGAVVLLLAILILGFWLPMASEKKRLTDRVEEKRETLVWMQQSVKKVQSGSPRRSGKDGRNLPSRVSAVLQQYKINDAKVSSKGGKKVSVRVESASFANLQNALHVLEERWLVEVENAKFTKIKDKVGEVSATLTLAREAR